MQMIIASRLVDGRVVFIDTEAGWHDSIEDGVLIQDETESDRLLAEAERAVEVNLIVDPYLIEVTVQGGARRPVEVREAIRAFGPSVRADQINGDS